MKQSVLFTRAFKSFPSDEEARGIRFLVRAGFVNKEAAGVYSFLPLGLRVLRNIESIIREEMDRVGGQEILMPILHPRENWEITGRWTSFDALYKVKNREGKEAALGPTHEEIIFPVIKKMVSSYRDLPVYVYQIQDKVRDEARAKSGLLRGREFWMKDFYSFHRDETDLDGFYEKMKKVYLGVFKRLGLKVLVVKASGGTFSKYSHEFQVLSPVGEDLVLYCGKCGFAENKEIAQVKDGEVCLECGGMIKAGSSIEVGNIFKLNTRFSEPFSVAYKDEEGNQRLVYAGCYGIGVSRLMGTIAEVLSDERGLIWPELEAPFLVHLLELDGGRGDVIYRDLQRSGIRVLYDDRKISAGEKFAEADLIGIPWRVVTSKKTGTKLEVKARSSAETRLVTLLNFKRLLKTKR